MERLTIFQIPYNIVSGDSERKALWGLSLYFYDRVILTERRQEGENNEKETFK